MSKASGVEGIPVELFQILKDNAVKVLHSICQQMWKTQQWPQDWKRSVFIPMPKNAQTTTQLQSSSVQFSSVAQSCLTLCDPRDCSPPGSSVHGIFQARVLEWVAISFSRRPSRPRDWNYHTSALISHASKVMLKILQARLQQSVNWELPDVQVGFRKGKGTRY